MCAWRAWEANTICKSILNSNKTIYRHSRIIFKSEILDRLDILNKNLATYDDSNINLLPVDEEKTTIIHRMKKPFFKQKYKYFCNNYDHILPNDCWNIIINQYDNVEPYLLPSKTTFYKDTCSIFDNIWFYKIYGNISNVLLILGVFILIINPYLIERHRLFICSILWIICILHVLIGFIIYELHFNHKYIGILHRCKGAMGNEVDYRDIELFEPFQEFCFIPLTWNVCIYNKTYSLYRKYKIINTKSSNGLLWKYINISIFLLYSIIYELYSDNIVFYECLFIIYTGCLLPVYFMWNNSIYYNDFSWYKNWHYFINGLFIGVILCIIIMDHYHKMPYYFRYVMYLPLIVWGTITHRFKCVLFMTICIWYLCLLNIGNNNFNDLYYILCVANEWKYCLFRLYIGILLFGDLYVTYLWNHSKYFILYYYFVSKLALTNKHKMITKLKEF